MIDPSKDIAGLQQAALEYLEDALSAPDRARQERIAAESKNGERVLRNIAAKRTLSHGYYVRVEYLLWLLSMIELGLVAFLQILAAEAEGMQAVTLARNQFQDEHPCCPGCGARNEAIAPRCGSCKRELAMKGAA